MATGTIKNNLIPKVIFQTTDVEDGENYSLISGETFSKYKYICAILRASVGDSRIRDAKTVPTIDWANTHKLLMSARHGASFEYFSCVEVEKVNDNSFSITLLGSMVLKRLTLYGIG